MNLSARTWLLIALGFLPLAANAQMFKCQEANGAYSYQAAPCEKITNQQVLKADGHAPIKVVTPKTADIGSAKPEVVSPKDTVSNPDSGQAVAPIEAGPSKGSSAADATVSPSKEEAPKIGLAGFTRIMGLVTILIFVVLFFIFLLPLKFAATLMNTERSGFLDCFFAGLLAVILDGAFSLFMPYKFLAIFVSALAFKWVLRTTYLKGVVIAAIAFLAYVVIPPFLLMAMMSKMPTPNHAPTAPGVSAENAITNRAVGWTNNLTLCG